MRYVAAYLLAVLGGNASPSAKDIKNILGSVGIEAEDEHLNKVCCLKYSIFLIDDLLLGG